MYTTWAGLLAFCSLTCATDITVYQPNVPFFPSPLPKPGPASHFEEIVTQFNRLGRSTVWDLVKSIKIKGDTGEPEGMVSLGEERYAISRGNWTERTQSFASGQIINGTNRSPGAGYSHLNIYDGDGNTIVDAQLTGDGDLEYHIGGKLYRGQTSMLTAKIWDRH
jgi:hypothetical protein